MQTEAEAEKDGRAAVAEIHAQAQLDRRRYQAMRDTLSDQARRAIGAAYSENTHRAAGDVDNPCTSPVVKMALKGISRQHGQAHAAALDAIRATAMLPRTGRRGVPETTDYAAARGQVDIALCSLLSDAGPRSDPQRRRR